MAPLHEVDQYFAKHDLHRIFEEAVYELGTSLPSCPLEFLSNFFDTKCNGDQPQGMKMQRSNTKAWREDALCRSRRSSGVSEVSILVVDVNDVVQPLLKKCGKVDQRPKMTEAELVACIGNYDALVCRSSVTVTHKILKAATKLQIIALSQVGTDNVPIQLCADMGIRVCNSPIGNTTTTAEHTLALMFSMVRNLPAADRSIRSGHWVREPFMGNQLSGSVLGLVGLGNIAFYVAKAAHSIGMEIVAYDPYVDQEKADSIGAKVYRTMEELPELFKRVKVLSIHVPLTPQTKNMVGKKEIAMMRRGSYIVNCARGGIVDEDALAEALNTGHLAGAAADVFVNEGTYVDNKSVPTDFSLACAPNMVLTPHLGAMTVEAQETVAMDAGFQVQDFFLRNSEPRFPVTKPDPADPTKLIDARPAWMRG